MSATANRPPIGRYRDAVTELLEAGTPFAEIEQAIARVHELDENERSALWLFALLKGDRAPRRPSAGRSRLAIVD